MMDINMICATARRHNLGQIKPTPLATDWVNRAQNCSSWLPSFFCFAKFFFVLTRFFGEEKSQCVAQISTFCQQVVQYLLLNGDVSVADSAVSNWSYMYIVISFLKHF